MSDKIDINSDRAKIETALRTGDRVSIVTAYSIFLDDERKLGHTVSQAKADLIGTDANADPMIIATFGDVQFNTAVESGKAAADSALMTDSAMVVDISRDDFTKGLATAFPGDGAKKFAATVSFDQVTAPNGNMNVGAIGTFNENPFHGLDKL